MDGLLVDCGSVEMLDLMRNYIEIFNNIDLEI